MDKNLNRMIYTQIFKYFNCKEIFKVKNIYMKIVYQLT